MTKTAAFEYAETVPLGPPSGPVRKPDLEFEAYITAIDKIAKTGGVDLTFCPRLMAPILASLWDVHWAAYAKAAGQENLPSEALKSRIIEFYRNERFL